MNILNKILPFFFKNTLTVFCYHDVTDNPKEFSKTYNLYVSKANFRYQLEFIKKKFNIINPDQLLDGLIPKNAALITFDDGFKSFFTNAIPILKDYQIPSINFLNMGPINKELSYNVLSCYLCSKREDFILYLKKNTDFKSNIAPYLFCTKSLINSYLQLVDKNFAEELVDFAGSFATKNDLLEGNKSDLIFFGNHLYHHDVALLLEDDEIINSYKKNKIELEKYSNYRDLFAFPFGQPNSCFSDRQISIFFEIGSKKVFGSSDTINEDYSSFYLDRFSLTNYDDTQNKIVKNILKAKIRPFYNSLKIRFSG